MKLIYHPLGNAPIDLRLLSPEDFKLAVQVISLHGRLENSAGELRTGRASVFAQNCRQLIDTHLARTGNKFAPLYSGPTGIILRDCFYRILIDEDRLGSSGGPAAQMSPLEDRLLHHPGRLFLDLLIGLGLTQRELAPEAGIEPATLSRTVRSVLKGDVSPTMSMTKFYEACSKLGLVHVLQYQPEPSEAGEPAQGATPIEPLAQHNWRELRLVAVVAELASHLSNGEEGLAKSALEKWLKRLYGTGNCDSSTALSQCVEKFICLAAWALSNRNAPGVSLSIQPEHVPDADGLMRPDSPDLEAWLSHQYMMESLLRESRWMRNIALVLPRLLLEPNQDMGGALLYRCLGISNPPPPLLQAARELARNANAFSSLRSAWRSDVIVAAMELERQALAKGAALQIVDPASQALLECNKILEAARLDPGRSVRDNMTRLIQEELLPHCGLSHLLVVCHPKDRRTAGPHRIFGADSTGIIDSKNQDEYQEEGLAPFRYMTTFMRSGLESEVVSMTLDELRQEWLASEYRDRFQMLVEGPLRKVLPALVHSDSPNACRIYLHMSRFGDGPCVASYSLLSSDSGKIQRVLKVIADKIAPKVPHILEGLDALRMACLDALTGILPKSDGANQKASPFPSHRPSIE